MMKELICNCCCVDALCSPLFWRKKKYFDKKLKGRFPWVASSVISSDTHTCDVVTGSCENREKRILFFRQFLWWGEDTIQWHIKIKGTIEKVFLGGNYGNHYNHPPKLIHKIVTNGLAFLLITILGILNTASNLKLHYSHRKKCIKYYTPFHDEGQSQASKVLTLLWEPHNLDVSLSWLPFTLDQNMYLDKH